MRFAHVFASALIASGASAQEHAPPPPFTVNEAFPSKSLRSPPAQGATFGRLRVRFDETPLQSVTSAFGVGQIAHRGDAGASMYWLCYTGQQPQPFRVWLVSQGEMGGTDHRLTEIQVAAVPSASASAQCPGLPPKFQRASLVGGLWVGSTARAWRAHLGPPSFENSAALQYV